MTRAEKAFLSALAVIGFMLITGLVLEAREAGAVDPRVPAASTVEIPITGSVKDDAGAVWAIAPGESIRISKTEGLPPIPVPPEPIPIPPPSGIVFGVVTETLGKVVIAKPSGWGLILHGSGFPVAGLLRLTVAGRIAPSVTLVWRPETINFTVPPGPPSATGPVTGPFEIYRQENNVWKLLGKGGQFTILPDLAPAARKTKKR